MLLALRALRAWPRRRFLVAVAAAAATALVTGVPTDLIDTPVFGRSIEVTAWSYPLWAVSAALVGLLVASAIRPAAPSAGGGLLTLLAVGCPVCNKPVVVLLGTSGALDLWAPLQPVLGGLAVALLAAALAVRLRGEVACAVPAPR